LKRTITVAGMDFQSQLNLYFLFIRFLSVSFVLFIIWKIVWPKICLVYREFIKLINYHFNVKMRYNFLILLFLFIAIAPLFNDSLREIFRDPDDYFLCPDGTIVTYTEVLNDGQNIGEFEENPPDHFCPEAVDWAVDMAWNSWMYYFFLWVLPCIMLQIKFYRNRKRLGRSDLKPTRKEGQPDNFAEMEATPASAEDDYESDESPEIRSGGEQEDKSESPNNLAEVWRNRHRQAMQLMGQNLIWAYPFIDLTEKISPQLNFALSEQRSKLLDKIENDFEGKMKEKGVDNKIREVWHSSLMNIIIIYGVEQYWEEHMTKQGLVFDKFEFNKYLYDSNCTPYVDGDFSFDYDQVESMQSILDDMFEQNEIFCVGDLDHHNDTLLDSSVDIRGRPRLSPEYLERKAARIKQNLSSQMEDFDRIMEIESSDVIEHEPNVTRDQKLTDQQEEEPTRVFDEGKSREEVLQKFESNYLQTRRNCFACEFESNNLSELQYHYRMVHHVLYDPKDNLVLKCFRCDELLDNSFKTKYSPDYQNIVHNCKGRQLNDQ